MKVVAKPIEMVAWLTRDGVPNPVRFKINNKDNTKSVIRINRIIKTAEERLAGNRILNFNSLGVVGEKERQFEISLNFVLVNGYFLKYNKAVAKLCYV